jgi:6-phosphogluconolactonase (cycloisomerase 2 family)
VPCALTAAVVLGLMAPASGAAQPFTRLVQLPGADGCLKGSVGKSWIRCPRKVLGQWDVSSVAISPDGRFAYGVSLYSSQTSGSDESGAPGGTIVAFSRDNRTGVLTQLPGDAACIKDKDSAVNGVTRPCAQSARGLTGAKTIVLSPDGRFAYVAALNNDAIAAFRRDPANGRLSQLPGDAACVQDVKVEVRECPRTARGLHGIRWITVSPDGKSLYASAPANDAIAAFARDPRTGALRQLPGEDACIEDRLARLSGSCPRTGVGLNYPRTITVSPDGRNVYVASDTADSTFPGDAADGDAVAAFRRDPGSGALTQLPGDDACIKDYTARRSTACGTVGKGLLDAFGVTVSPDGRNVYVGSNVNKRGAVAAFQRDASSGALSQLPGAAACLGSRDCTPVRGMAGVDAVTISADGEHAYVAAYFGPTLLVLDRDKQSGELRQVPGQGACIRDPSSPEDCPVTANGLKGPRNVSLSPDGRFAYVPSSVSGTIDVFAVHVGR